MKRTTRAIAIVSTVLFCSITILTLIWIKGLVTPGYQFVIDWMIILMSIFLEVFGISLFLDWLINLNRNKRLEPRQQIALRRLFTVLNRDLYISLARNNETETPLTEEEDLQLRAKGIVTPSTNYPLDRYLLHIAITTQSAIRLLGQLVDRFWDLFEIEFVNDLFLIAEIASRIVEDGIFVQNQVKIEKNEAVRIKVAEKVNETFNLFRLQLMRFCTEFIVKRIYPLSSIELKQLIRFHLLNFHVHYNSRLCDLVLDGKRMKPSKQAVRVDLGGS
ncbi:MAG: hypothetical protein ACFFE2_16000 [Candidatus Thorarchaeota archaeon]